MPTLIEAIEPVVLVEEEFEYREKQNQKVFVGSFGV